MPLQHCFESAVGFLGARHEIKARLYPLRTFGGIVGLILLLHGKQLIRVCVRGVSNV